MKPNPCLEIMADFDPYMCGDDLIVPSQKFHNATDFMSFFPPISMDVSSIKVCCPKDEDCPKHVPRCEQPCFNGIPTEVSASTSLIFQFGNLLIILATAITLVNWM